MHRYTIEGVADSERDPSPDNPDNDPDAADRPLSFAY
jgi:cytochrome d ubiquinol oxidase subunit I